MRTTRRVTISRVLIALAFLLVLAGYVLNRNPQLDTTSIAVYFHGQLLTQNLQSTIAPLVARPDRPTEIVDLPVRIQRAAISALATALAIYPPGFIDKRLARIALAGQIKLWDTEVGGFFAQDTIALNAHDAATPGGQTFLADSFHHELSSIIRNEILFNVTDWIAQNPPTFTYANMAEYRKILAQRPPVEGDPALHAQGFVSLYGTTSLDNDWNTYAERVFGHAADLAALITTFPKMREKTRQFLDIYDKLDPRLEKYFTNTGLRRAAEIGQSAP